MGSPVDANVSGHGNVWATVWFAHDSDHGNLQRAMRAKRDDEKKKEKKEKKSSESKVPVPRVRTVSSPCSRSSPKELPDRIRIRIRIRSICSLKTQVLPFPLSLASLVRDSFSRFGRIFLSLASLDYFFSLASLGFLSLASLDFFSLRASLISLASLVSLAPLESFSRSARTASLVRNSPLKPF